MMSRKASYLLGICLMGCVSSVNQSSSLPTAPLIPAPQARVYFLSKDNDNYNAAYLYRDALLSYSRYLDEYVLDLTTDMRLPPLPKPEPTCKKRKVKFPTLRLPSIPNVRGLSDQEIIDELIIHIEKLENTVSDYSSEVADLKAELETSC